MEDLPNYSSENSRINISRNRPIAFIVGVSGFLGSFVAEHLLAKGIQVIGVDDFSSGKKEHLERLTKERDFHFLNISINEALFASNTLAALSLDRLDYAFFLAEDTHSSELLSTGLVNFLYFVQKHSLSADPKKDRLKKNVKELSRVTRIVFGSSVLLYNEELNEKERRLKEAEVLFARFCKEEKLNGRVIRFGTLFGPRMHFREQDPLIQLIRSAIAGKIEDKKTGMNFVTQGVYVEDAADLVVKSVLLGSTAHKIYDCLRAHPVYIAELKQLLLDPVWFEENGFKVTKLPEWLSPNLLKTMKELHWHPKTSFHDALQETIRYFNQHHIALGEEREVKQEKGRLSHWTFSNPLFKEEEAVEEGIEEVEGEEKIYDEEEKVEVRGWKKYAMRLLVVGLIVLGLVVPVFQIAWGAYSIKSNLAASSKAIEEGDFEQAFVKVKVAGEGIMEAKQVFGSLALVQRLGIFSKQIDDLNRILAVVDEGVEGMNHAVVGTEALFQSVKVISGDSSTEEPLKLYEKAQTELTEAQKKLQGVQIALSDEDLVRGMPDMLKSRVEDMQLRVVDYSELVDKARAAAFLLPSITAIDGKKSYLVLLQNNLELRAGGGFIGSYGKIIFEKGKVVEIKVDDVYNLDGGLADVIAPPAELKNDLGQNRWYMRDANTEPDFPTSARQAELFYRRTTGEVVNGVVALNLSASAKLVDAVGGVDLPEYGESVNGANLFERTVNKAETGFFPGSQAKKNYLTALQNQLFNKIFYLSKQNWPAIIKAVGESLEQKQMMVYLADPTLFSYAVSENWGGVLPRGVASSSGQLQDFMMLTEANMGANKANYYVKREVKLETVIGKEGQVSEKLTVAYKNTSPANVFPGGPYKNRFKVYLPLGAKLLKLSYGEADLTNQVASFTDYGRTGYSVLLNLEPGEQKNVVMLYDLPSVLTFENGRAVYRLDLIKQSGIINDPLEWKLSYPLNMYIVDASGEGEKGEQQLNFKTDLTTDRAFQLIFEKR